MKKIFLIVLSIFFFSGCENDESLVFVAKDDEASLTFLNTFANEYLISEAVEDNIAERFVWTRPNFGAPVNISYELQASIDATFATFEVIGATPETNLAVTIKQLLRFAANQGLDDDPATTTAEGAPNNTGQVFFRLRAFTGTGSANAVETLSEIQPLPIKWLEKAPDGTACPSIWVVGAGAVEAGWGWSTPIEFTCENEVYTARIALTNQTFRFFEEEGNWASGLNYPHFEGEGYTIDANFENAQDGDSNFKFIGTPGVYTLTVDGNQKTITLTPSPQLFLLGDAVPSGWSWDNPVQTTEERAYVRKITLALKAGIFRFFTTRNDWGSGLNYPYFEEEGYTIDPAFVNAVDGDSNFKFVGTPGTYTLVINEKEKTIKLE